MIKLFATICLLAAPADCHDVLVANSDVNPGLNVMSCQAGMAGLADWMKDYPEYRFARWRCWIGQRVDRRPA